MNRPLPTYNVQRGSSSGCYQLDPLRDPRWSEFVERHPKASVFHTVGWLNGLRRTYGYEPVAFTTSPPTSALKNGLVFCRVESWLTGRRLVSLPFSDHCEPLCDSTEELNYLIRCLQTAVKHQNWRYVEVRSINGNVGEVSDANGFQPSARYFLHILDLRSDLNEVFRSLDKDSVRRRIQRAERAGLVERCGKSDELLKEFYGLFIGTRSRHHLPPSPYDWFRNLIQCQGKALEIRLAYKDKIPISAILTLQFRDVVYYKYGCSEVQFNKFGATPWLLWRAITAAKSDGANEFDMGRTQEDEEGLLAFKNHWVPQPKQLVYRRFPDTSSLDSADGWKLKAARRAFSCMPHRLLTIIGKMIYRHIG
jgi:hypothetical protein